MLFARVLTAAMKPALVASIAGGAVTGGWFAFDHWSGDDPTAFQRVQSQGQQLIISEFGEDEDTIVAVDPSDASARTVIARIKHAAGYGVFATLSPDGESIAYTALPEDAIDVQAETPAHAAIVDADGGTTLLATDVDLRVPPIWSPDGESIVVRRNTPVENSAGTFELLLLSRDGSRSTLTTWTTAAVFPIAFSPEGDTLYFAALSTSGTDLYAFELDSADETLVAHLADEIARDWQLSPDGSTLAYTVLDLHAETAEAQNAFVWTLDLASGAAQRATASKTTRAEVDPVWKPDGELTIAVVDPQGGGRALTVGAAGGEQELTNNDVDLERPLGWSPDGTALAVHAVEGSSGYGRVEVLQPDGGRERVSENVDTLIVGWLE